MPVVAPSAPAFVTVFFRGAPEGAEVRDEAGIVLCRAGEGLRLPKGDAAVRLELVATGYESQSVTIVPNSTSTVEVSMNPIAKKPVPSKRKTRRAKPSADDIEGWQ